MSTKTSTQPGRRTPLSLSGAVTKSHPNKIANNAANGGGGNANGHTTSSTNRQDSKLQQQKNETQITNNSEIKENPNKKQQPQPDKKPQQNDNKKSNEKSQNGVSSNKQQQSNENKQQQQQNGNGDDNKVNEKDKREKPEKSDKVDKTQDKFEKEETKLKEDKKVEQDKLDNKKDERKPKETKDAKEDKKEETTKSDAKTEQHPKIKNDDKKSKEDNQTKNADQKPEEKIEKMEVVEEKQIPQKCNPVTPKSNIKAGKASTPVNKTPIKVNDKTPQKSMPPTNTVKATSVIKKEVTVTVDNNDIEMEPLIIESSPIKSSQPIEVTNINNIAPSATSTPGKIILPKRNSGAPKSEVQLAMQTRITPERPRAFSQISGRKSIRPISDYTPSKFQSNSQFRESYKRINTELDVTNTSMNVTVGSEVPSNLSFSFFGRGRKRDRTPPQHSQSAIGELQTDMEVSPPKKARIDMHGFFSVVSSPLSLLRNRFSKASLQSSTPVKMQLKLDTAEDEIEVQNVSGVSVHEEIAKSDREPAETINDDTLGEEAKENSLKADILTPTSTETEEGKDVSSKCEKTCGMEQASEQLGIKITETPLQPAVGDPMAKNKRCTVM